MRRHALQARTARGIDCAPTLAEAVERRSSPVPDRSPGACEVFGDPGSDRTIRRKGRRATETPEDFEVSETPSSAKGDIVGPDEAWADENEPGPQPAADYAPRADTDDAPAS